MRAARHGCSCFDGAGRPVLMMPDAIDTINVASGTHRTFFFMYRPGPLGKSSKE